MKSGSSVKDQVAHVQESHTMSNIYIYIYIQYGENEMNLLFFRPFLSFTFKDTFVH